METQHKEDTEALLEEKDKSLNGNEVADDGTGVDVSLSESDQEQTEKRNGHKTELKTSEHKKESNNNEDDTGIECGDNDSSKAKEASVECEKEVTVSENDINAALDNNELNIDKAADETCNIVKVCDKCDKESLDNIDGNWLSREPIKYDIVDTFEVSETDQTKHRTVLDKLFYSFGILKASVVPIVSVIIFTYDIGGDVQLAMKYRTTGHMTYFWITVACIVFPAMLMAVVDIFWIVMGKYERSSKFKCHDVCRIIIGGLSLGRLVRACTCAVHTIQGIRKPHQKEHDLKADVKRRDEALLNFISAFTEDIVMLSVQLYIYFTGHVKFAIPAHSLVGSTIGIAWTYSCLYRDGRKARRRSQNLRIFGFIVFFIAAIAAMAAREISIVFFVIYAKIWTSVVVLVVHCIVMYIWLWWQHRKEGGANAGAWAKRLYLGFIAFVSVFNFINVKSGNAAVRMIMFYVILYLESAAMAGVAFSKIQQSNYGDNVVYYLLALPIGFAIHVPFIIIHYSCFHANHNACCVCDIEV